jgi:tetratricopeptide (TPR) repeat protein
MTPPNLMTDLLQQAIDAHRTNNLIEAERLYRLAFDGDPNLPDARYNLGMLYGQKNHIEDAFKEFKLAVDIKPDFGEAWLMLSQCANQLGQDDLGLEASIRAVQLLPTIARAWMRHGVALNRLNRDEEAVAAYRRATKLEPGFINAWINLGVALKNSGQPQEAEQAILHAIHISGATLDTDDAAEDNYNILHWHLALLKLGLDQYKEGFAYFRARFKGGTNWNRFQNTAPLWRSEDIQGKSILITAEQGHGDMLMMARYLPLLKARGAKIIFQTHPALKRYFTGWNGADQVIATDEPLSMSFNFHVPIFDLPYRFNTSLQTIPAQIPYLPLSEADAKTQLAVSTQKRIGVIWAGQPDNARDKLRSLPLAIFACIFDVQSLTFYNLTRDLKAGDTDILQQKNVVNLASHLNDFADTARLINQLDLVITCDTAMAHLAGGMGKAVWVLLPFVPDWRWGYSRRDTPWYPTAKLFRQHQRGDWSGAMQEIKSALQTIK